MNSLVDVVQLNVTKTILDYFLKSNNYQLGTLILLE